MRQLFLAFLLGSMLSGCADSTSPLPTPPADVDSEPSAAPGRLVVYVHWEGGSPGKQIEVIEAGAEKVTDQAGLAGFALAPGTYTVRAWDIGMPGPGSVSIDFTVTVRRGETTRLEIFDCVPCV